MLQEMWEHKVSLDGERLQPYYRICHYLLPANRWDF